jgi:hypothetical protein
MKMKTANFNAQCGLLKTLEEEMSRASGARLKTLKAEHDAEKAELAKMPLP